MKRAPTDQFSKEARREAFCQTLVKTGNARLALQAAGYKDTPLNRWKQWQRMKKDARVAKRLKEILEEKYSSVDRATDVVELLKLAKEAAKVSGKPADLLAVAQTIAKLSGLGEGLPTQHVLHGHAVLSPGQNPATPVSVIESLRLPKE